MLERKLLVRNALGIHARAAAKLVRLASTFQSSITIRRPEAGVTADAKSILSVLHIAAGRGSAILLTVDGLDEEEAVSAIERLFNEGFGEL